MFCVGITSSDAAHVQQVVRVTDQEAAVLDQAERTFAKWLKQSGLDGNKELQLALLAKLSKGLISDLTPENRESGMGEQIEMFGEATADDS